MSSKPWDVFAEPGAPVMDFVFTVCDDAAGETCPVWPGQPMTAHWGIEDPAKVEGTDIEKEAAFVARLPLPQEPHLGLHQPAAPLDRRPGARQPAPRHRQDGGSDRQGRRPGRHPDPAMSEAALGRRLGAEAVGTALLLATVVGSGIMAERLAGGNVAVALLGNTIPTGAILVVLILVFGPVSGAHFNPAVSLAFALRGTLAWPLLAAYVAAQLAGAVLGVWAAHAMFDVPVWQLSTTIRTGPGQWFAEFVATFGLLTAILGCVARSPGAVPWAVGLYITAAYWFTASTSFANPAVTVARALTASFSGIAPADVPAFIAAQLLGAIVGLAFARWMFKGEPSAA